MQKTVLTPEAKIRKLQKELREIKAKLENTNHELAASENQVKTLTNIIINKADVKVVQKEVKHMYLDQGHPTYYYTTNTAIVDKFGNKISEIVTEK